MSKQKTKHDREWKALQTLQQDHSYWLSRVPAKSQRLTSTFSRDKKSGRTTFATRYVVQFALPLDSALAKAMIEADKKQDKPKPKRRVSP